MPGGVVTQTLITTLPGLDEHRCVNKEHFRVVPSTEAAVDHITAAANDRQEDEGGVLMGLITDIDGSGRAGEPR